MISWPRPASIKALRGFLGLTDYYRRFVKVYGIISKPLTELLKKGNFHWDSKAEDTFMRLRRAMEEVLELAPPDFSKPFVLETDASNMGIGAVLM